MTRTLATLAALLALAMAGCGGDDEPSSEPGGGSGAAGGGQQVALSAPADGSLVFEPDALEAEAGTITIDFDNQSSSTPHAVEIEGQESDTVTGSQTSVTVDLQAGEYEFVCPVGTHESQGMKGTLTVK